MSLKLTIMKYAVRRKRKKEVWKNPVGQSFIVPRNGKKGVDVLLYRPRQVGEPWPVIFNIHGGAWVGCDASQMDSYCLDMVEKCGAFIVGINYTKLDVQPFPYPQEEIRDTVLWFREHAGEYGIDPERFALMGYSAGGHLAAASALMLKEQGFNISAQVLCYPFLDFTEDGGILDGEENSVMEEFFFPSGVDRRDPYISPVMATEEQLKGMGNVVFVTCGSDPLRLHAGHYRDKLLAAGVSVSNRMYEDALHGFLEVNHREYPPQEGKNPEQEKLAKEAEDYIAFELKKIWSTKQEAKR